MLQGTHYQRFQSVGTSPHERFDSMRTWYSEAVESVMRLDPVGEIPADFTAKVEVLSIGELDLVEVEVGPALGRWPLSSTEGPDLVRVDLFHRSPRVGAHWHGHDAAPESGTPVLFGRTSGWWHAPAGLTTIQVNVPRPLLDLPDAALDRIIERQVPPDFPVVVALLRPMLRGIVGRLEPLAATATAELAALWLSAVTLLLRSLHGRDAQSEDVIPAQRLLAQRFIDAHLADPGLTPEAVAAALHLSRRSLYRLWAGEGDGVAGAIRRRRLDRAGELLADPRYAHRTIADIAAAVGLPSGPQFSRMFRVQFGVSPRDWRAGASRV